MPCKVTFRTCFVQSSKVSMRSPKLIVKYFPTKKSFFFASFVFAFVIEMVQKITKNLPFQTSNLHIFGVSFRCGSPDVITKKHILLHCRLIFTKRRDLKVNNFNLDYSSSEERSST